MRIQANYFNYLPLQNKNSKFNSAPNKANRLVSDTFKSKNVSFGEKVNYTRWVVYDRFDPLNASDSELKNMAEILNNENIENIAGAIDKRYKAGILTTNTEDKRKIAKNKLLPLVEKVQEDKRNQAEIVDKLTKKQLNGDSNIVIQKQNLKKEFLAPLRQVIEENNDTEIANSILIYGNSEDKKKDDFTEWMRQEASHIGVSAKTFDLWRYNTAYTMEKIDSQLETFKRYNEITGFHSIIFVKGLDELLDDVNKTEASHYINNLKAMMQNSAEKYHTTFVIQTAKPLSKIDSDTSVNKICDLKVDLNDGITDDEKIILLSAKHKLAFYDEKSKQAKNYFGWENFSYDDDIHWGPGDPSYEIGR